MSANGDVFTIVPGRTPLVAAAIHDGHGVRPEVAELLALSDQQRRREEDPGTGGWTAVFDARIIVHRSRFEVDLNRPRDQAVYQSPEDAWGLKVWASDPPAGLVERSRDEYDAFYRAVRRLLCEKARRHRRFVVYDLHSYNHRRAGAQAQPADPATNPDINVGTGSMDRSCWGPVADRLIEDLASASFRGTTLDVRENVNFKGGEFPAWVHREFPGEGCAIALEFKKFFMDEWTGELHENDVAAILSALRRAARGTLEVLTSL
jgi:N-formylglutamate amidohydrolase